MLGRTICPPQHFLCPQYRKHSTESVEVLVHERICDVRKSDKSIV
jgi:hypothetical protein